MIELRTELREQLGADPSFDQILALDGETYRQAHQRRTFRFERGGRSYFIKLHHGVGWREILKNLFSLRIPVISARDEWRAIRRLHQLGVDSMTIAGFGERHRNPARRQSFLITDELQDVISLEDFCVEWSQSPPPVAFKHRLLKKVAEITRRLHENGVNHRDLYICHFLLDTTALQNEHSDAVIRLYVIDLHRAQLRRRVPKRWLIKDLAGLMFSSADIGLSRLDWFRFMAEYRGRPLRSILREEASFWRKVRDRAVRLYQKEHGVPFPVRTN